MDDLSKVQKYIQWELIGLKIRRERIMREFLPRTLFLFLVCFSAMAFVFSDRFGNWILQANRYQIAAVFLAEVLFVWWFRGLCIKWEKGIKDI